MQRQFTIVLGVIVNENKEILLAKRNQPESPEVHGKWEFPGGGIEFGEEPEQALLREVKEETGLEVKIVRLLPKIYTNLWKKSNRTDQVILLSYECQIISGTPTANLEENIGELKFVALEDIKQLDTLPQVYEMASMIKSNSNP